LGCGGGGATRTVKRGVELTQAFSIGAIVWLCPSRKLAARQLRLLDARARRKHGSLGFASLLPNVTERLTVRSKAVHDFDIQRSRNISAP
jgi:hypothetical protein